jgi:16S rRNA (uracil1498-N3)-methyltransferase
MNLILLFKEDFIYEQRVQLKGRRHKHVLEILRPSVGQRLCVGVINGRVGFGTVTALTDKFLEMDVVLESQPPAALPVTLVLALPRPIVLKRVLQTLSSMGVKRIILLHCRRVEKSFWKSPSLSDEAIEEALVLGLEQARDTSLPKVLLRKQFKPFVEDELPGFINGTLALVAHPETKTPCPRDVKKSVTLVIGPEGGFIPYEIEKLRALGFTPVHLGQRILRVETAVTVLLSRLF